MKKDVVRYYLGLGSNLGDRNINLGKAVAFLKTIGDVEQVSSAYETEPVGMAPGTENFYNQVISMKSQLAPELLLSRIKEFEMSMGRDLAHSHNWPRTIDIDILLAGDTVLNQGNLVIPHPEMHKRVFVLLPLAEIAPELMHPILKKSIKEILCQLKDQNSDLFFRR